MCAALARLHNGSLRTNRCLGVAVAFAVLLTGGAARADSLDQFRSVLFQYFTRLNYIPVIVDRGYTVGDVVQADGISFFGRARTCFPTLSEPKPTDTALPDLIQTDGGGLNFGLKLKQIFDSAVAANLTRQIEIRFSDITVISVPLLDLRGSLNREKCPELAPLVDQVRSKIEPGKPPFFIVSEVLRGKRSAVLRFKPGANIEFDTNRISGLIGDARINVTASRDGTVYLKSDMIASIAIRPVTVPKLVELKAFDLRGDSLVIDWQEVGCRNDRTCNKSFSDFAQMIAARHPTLSSDDLLQ